MAAGKRTSAARKTAGIKGKRITAKQRVARKKNIAIARMHKRSKLTGKKPSGGGGFGRVKKTRTTKHTKAREALYQKTATDFTKGVSAAAKKVYGW